MVFERSPRVSSTYRIVRLLRPTSRVATGGDHRGGAAVADRGAQQQCLGAVRRPSTRRCAWAASTSCCDARPGPSRLRSSSVWPSRSSCRRSSCCRCWYRRHDRQPDAAPSLADGAARLPRGAGARLDGRPKSPQVSSRSTRLRSPAARVPSAAEPSGDPARSGGGRRSGAGPDGSRGGPGGPPDGAGGAPGGGGSSSATGEGGILGLGGGDWSADTDHVFTYNAPTWYAWLPADAGSVMEHFRTRAHRRRCRGDRSLAAETGPRTGAR